MSDAVQARQLVEEAERILGPLDVLVCNAGVALPQQLLTDTTDEQWKRVMGVDLDGVFYTIRAAVPGMVRRQKGSIVTVSSMWGVTGGSCEVAYSAAKAGVIGLTRALAKELGPSHIRVNCVAPGVIDTEMNGALDEQAMEWLVTNNNGCHLIYSREENGLLYGECGDTDPEADLPAGKYLHVVRNGSGGYVATVVDQCDGGSSGYPGGSWPSFPWWQ